MDQESPRRPPRERFVGTELLFDLDAEGERLAAENGGMRDGHRQITLFRGGGVSIVLFDFERDGWLKDHAADRYVTIEVLSGELRMSTAEHEYLMPSRSLLVLRPGVRHDVRAEAPSRMLLTVRLDPAEDERP
jgi:quercetin dioxygenase-like cupin family protein